MLHCCINRLMRPKHEYTEKYCYCYFQVRKMGGMFNIIKSSQVKVRFKALALLNIIAMGYVLMMTVACSLIAMVDAIPLMFMASPSTALLHRCISFYLLVQVVGNFLLAYRTDSSVRTLRGYGPEDCELRMTCTQCGQHVPRRCHHCPLCNTCILKRDHHCFFMCTCIGYHNQKYFIIFCFYTVLSTIYGCRMGANYMDILYEVRSSHIWWVYNLPRTIWYWLTADVRYPQVILAILYHNAIVSLIVSTGFFAWQIYITFKGQTSYEARRGITTHSRTVKENFYDTFGPYWYITLVLPIPLPQCGQGVYTTNSDILHCDSCKNL